MFRPRTMSTRDFPVVTPTAATVRFGNRVADYVRARPGYPPQLVDVLRSHCGFVPGIEVADVGSGTGLFTRLLLENGARVHAVEPNREMREAGEALLAGLAGFTSIGAPAEATGLPDRSVDMVTAAQAFHWFDRPRARTEFARILRPRGSVVLVWNDRRLDTTEFLRGYEALLVQHCPEYLQVVHRNVTDEVLAEFFHPRGFEAVVLDNVQVFDWDLLVARHDSQSYVPKEGPRRDALLADLRALFDRTVSPSGTVAFEYDTRVFIGQLAGG